jgi:hypothetical protein
MEWQKPKYNEDGVVVSIPDNWLYIHYYEALSSLFRIENSLRVFVFIVLKTEIGHNWPDLEITSEDGSQTTINKLAKRRIAQGKTFGYLGFHITSPLMYLTSGELVAIIISENCWRHFNKYFLAAKHVVTLKLQEIGNIRNSLAHFRPIKQDDVEVVKQNATQVLSGVESVLEEATSCIDRVPTNTQDMWYQELSTLGTQQCKFLFNQSRDKNWVKITLQFRCRALNAPKENTSGYFRFDVLKIDSAECIKNFSRICQIVTILTEQIDYPGWRIKPEILFGKDLQFIFGAKVLEENYSELRNEIEQLISKIAQEVELINEDHLARGELVQLVHIDASEKKHENRTYWKFNTAQLYRPVEANDPAEYWGNLQMPNENLITETNIFPWMHVDISSVSVPF